MTTTTRSQAVSKATLDRCSLILLEAKQRIEEILLCPVNLTFQVTHDYSGIVNKHSLTINDVRYIVSKITGVSINDMKKATRKAKAVEARHIAMSISRELNLGTLVLIAQHFNRKDHSTVLHAIHTINNLRSYDKGLNSLYLKCKEACLQYAKNRKLAGKNEESDQKTS